MNRHQLNGVMSFLELLDQAADRGIVIYGSNGIQLEVDDEDTAMEIVRRDGHYALDVRP